MSTDTRPHGYSPDQCRYCRRYRRACGRNYFEASTPVRTRAADALRELAAGAVALARRIDPPTYGVRVVWDDDYADQRDDYTTETEQRIRSGEWISVGMVAIERDRDGIVRETDTPASLWGIVTDASDLADGWSAYGLDEPVNVFELDTLSGYLRTVAGDLIAEARP